MPLVYNTDMIVDSAKASHSQCATNLRKRLVGKLLREGDTLSGSHCTPAASAGNLHVKVQHEFQNSVWAIAFAVAGGCDGESMLSFAAISHVSESSS
eukprot:4244098-Amphidinium_carterae.2